MLNPPCAAVPQSLSAQITESFQKFGACLTSARFTESVTVTDSGRTYVVACAEGECTTLRLFDQSEAQADFRTISITQTLACQLGLVVSFSSGCVAKLITKLSRDQLRKIKTTTHRMHRMHRTHRPRPFCAFYAWRAVGGSR